MVAGHRSIFQLVRKRANHIGEIRNRHLRFIIVCRKLAVYNLFIEFQLCVGLFDRRGVVFLIVRKRIIQFARCLNSAGEVGIVVELNRADGVFEVLRRCGFIALNLFKGRVVQAATHRCVIGVGAIGKADVIHNKASAVHLRGSRAVQRHNADVYAADIVNLFAHGAQVNSAHSRAVLKLVQSNIDIALVTIGKRADRAGTALGSKAVGRTGTGNGDPFTGLHIHNLICLLRTGHIHIQVITFGMPVIRGRNIERKQEINILQLAKIYIKYKSDRIVSAIGSTPAFCIAAELPVSDALQIVVVAGRGIEVARNADRVHIAGRVAFIAREEAAVNGYLRAFRAAGTDFIGDNGVCRSKIQRVIQTVLVGIL